MAATTVDTGSPSLAEFDTDLASVAAQAALELDHLSLGRPIGFSATQRLVDLIGKAVTDVSEPVSPHTLLNPGTAVALGKAFHEALGPPAMTRVPELIKQAANFKDRLAAIAASSEGALSTEIETLRNVCIALSRQAVAVESAARYRREHPFKKYL
jgi:hypothetical protein